MNKERNLASKNDVGNVVELKFNPRSSESARKYGNFFSIRSQAQRLNLLLYRLLTFKRRRRDRIFHDLYERQKRGLLLSPFLRALEAHAIFPGARNLSDLSFDGGTKQEKGNKPKDESYGRPNESVGHSGIGMANVK